MVFQPNPPGEAMRSASSLLSAVVCVAVLCVCFTAILSAQDAAKVDAKHYTVLSENDQVRILKVHYGPHEKSVMHSHPNAVAVFLTSSKARFTFPDGKTLDANVKAGKPVIV